MPICRRQTFKTVRLRFVISRLGWSYYPLYPASCGENPGPPDWPFWLCAGIRGTPRRLCPWHELSRFPKTVRHPCRAATVRERWLNAWPANAPDPEGTPVAALIGRHVRPLLCRTPLGWGSFNRRPTCANGLTPPASRGIVCRRAPPASSLASVAYPITCSRSQAYRKAECRVSPSNR